MLNINININKKNINIENLDKSVITCVIIFLGGLVVYVASLAYLVRLWKNMMINWVLALLQ